MFKKTLVITIFTSLLFSPFSLDIKNLNISQAYTIGGNLVIDANTTWTKNNSPYVIDQYKVTIKQGATLTIEPGVIVKLNKGSIAIDGGMLMASGTAEMPIVFTSNNDNARGGDTNADSSLLSAPGDWEQIAVWNGGKIFLDFVQINYGGSRQVYQVRNSLIDINHAHAYSESAPVISLYQASAEIYNSEITGNGDGIYVRYSDLDSDFVMHNSKIYNNGGTAFNWYDGKMADVTNNWWGDDSGPYHDINNSIGKGEVIYGNAIFDPWIGKGNDNRKNPVIIVPGIMGSYLNRNDTEREEIWPNIGKMIWADDAYLDELIMPSNGELTSVDIVPTDILRNISDVDMFKGLIAGLKNDGYMEGVNLFVFPYDWRLSVDILAGQGAANYQHNLANRILAVKNQTDASKVDIIAHSMGGLVVKRYLQVFGTSSVDKFIDIATPHLGAPKAFKALTYGDNMGFASHGIGLNQGRVKIITQNMPAVYQLLPSAQYFAGNGIDYNSYLADIYDVDKNGVEGNLNYSASVDLMKNMGRNAILLDQAKAVHANIDEYYPQDNGVATYNLLGCGTPTIGRIYILDKEKTGGYEYGLRYIDGDGTVPVKSAMKMLYPDLFIRNTEHAFLPGAEGSGKLVSAILNDKLSEFDYDTATSSSNSENICGISGTQVSFHSPIDLHVYDEVGNHSGPSTNGDIEYNIPGAQYDVVDGNKFVFLPSGQQYRIEGQATGVGTFNARVENVLNGDYVSGKYFDQVPLRSTSTVVEMLVGTGVTQNIIKLDSTGDGFFESSILPSANMIRNELGDLITPPIKKCHADSDKNNNKKKKNDKDNEKNCKDKKKELKKNSKEKDKKDSYDKRGDKDNRLKKK